MTEVTKKISFGFTKSKVGSVKKVENSPASVEYISCFDRNTIILKSTKTEEPASGNGEENINSDARVPATDKSAAVIPTAASVSDPEVKTPLTLEQRAADELLRDAKQFGTVDQTEVSQSPILQITQSKHRVDSEVSTNEDYEEMPVENFGLALLRGMGWDSSRGIGKKPQVVSAVKQVLRPKGVGLGAEKKNLSSNNIPASGRDEEELKVKAGAYLKITSGTHRDKYGKILGFNEESGRLIVELSCGGANVSVNESAVQLVAKEHYNKYSRVLNAAKYESYIRGSEMENRSDNRKFQKRKHELI